MNVAAAAKGQPVIHGLIDAGAVRNRLPPSGFPARDALPRCFQYASALGTDGPVLCVGGLMMGSTTDDLGQPVTKTTAVMVWSCRGTHPVRKLTPAKAQTSVEVGLRPVPLLRSSARGSCWAAPWNRTQVMRSLAFTTTGADYWNQLSALCCSCGLCTPTQHACPEELFPRKPATTQGAEMRRRTLRMEQARPRSATPDAGRGGGCHSAVAQRLEVEQYEHHAPFAGGTDYAGKWSAAQAERGVTTQRWERGPGGPEPVRGSAGGGAGRRAACAVPGQVTAVTGDSICLNRIP